MADSGNMRADGKSAERLTGRRKRGPQGFPKSLNPQLFCQRLFRDFSKTRPLHGKLRSIWRTLSLN